jgi:hypothetical protein
VRQKEQCHRELAQQSQQAYQALICHRGTFKPNCQLRARSSPQQLRDLAVINRDKQFVLVTCNVKRDRELLVRASMAKYSVVCSLKSLGCSHRVFSFSPEFENALCNKMVSCGPMAGAVDVVSHLGDQ